MLYNTNHSGKQSKEIILFAYSNAVVMSSNLIRGMDVPECSFCVCVFLCVDRGLSAG
jgi:hypothetical protein